MPTDDINRYQWFLEAVQNHTSDECLIWPFCINDAGYGIIHVRGMMPKNIRVHRLAFQFVHGYWPMPQGRHSCDVRACFNPRHTLEGTQADNSADMVRRGRQGPMIRPGETNPFAKLNDDLVHQIRQLHEVMGYRKLSKKFNVSRATIRSVIKRTGWSHIT